MHQGVIEVLKSDSWEFDRFCEHAWSKTSFVKNGCYDPSFHSLSCGRAEDIIIVPNLSKQYVCSSGIYQRSAAVVYIIGLQQWYISEVGSSGVYQRSAAVVYIIGLQQWYISEVCSSGIYERSAAVVYQRSAAVVYVRGLQQ